MFLHLPARMSGILTTPRWMKARINTHKWAGAAVQAGMLQGEERNLQKVTQTNDTFHCRVCQHLIYILNLTSSATGWKTLQKMKDKRKKLKRFFCNYKGNMIFFFFLNANTGIIRFSWAYNNLITQQWSKAPFITAPNGHVSSGPLEGGKLSSKSGDKWTLFSPN